jgi:hypothetical protein
MVEAFVVNIKDAAKPGERTTLKQPPPQQQQPQ